MRRVFWLLIALIFLAACGRGATPTVAPTRPPTHSSGPTHEPVFTNDERPPDASDRQHATGFQRDRVGGHHRLTDNIRLYSHPDRPAHRPGRGRHRRQDR